MQLCHISLDFLGGINKIQREHMRLWRPSWHWDRLRSSHVVDELSECCGLQKGEAITLEEYSFADNSQNVNSVQRH